MRKLLTLKDLRALGLLAVLAVTGAVSSGYVLLHERAPNPFSHRYDIHVAFTAANGVEPGLGQPVQVAGVNAGAITAAHVRGGISVLTLSMKRAEVPHVYANAMATLDPITPLGDVQINLDPGRPPAPMLSKRAVLGIGRSASPVALSTLLSTLDADTRDFLTSMLSSMGQGTAGRAGDLRRALVSLGPTVDQAHDLASALAHRRRALARLVHNLALVTRAASQDDELASVVAAGNATLSAVASQDRALKRSIQVLPDTLQATNRTLADAATFGDKLTPAAKALLPGVRRLPATLAALDPVVREATTLVRSKIRPLVSRAQPVVRNLGPATSHLADLAPRMTSVFQTAKYTTNELAYNPKGKDEGMLLWLPFAAHNWNSLFGYGDAHGGFGRAMAFVSCSELLNLDGDLGPVMKTLLGAATICPKR